MVDWQITRDGLVETEVFDVDPLTDTLNPFGDAVVFRVDDIQGDKFEQYDRGTRVEASVFPEGGEIVVRFIRRSNSRFVRDGDTDRGAPVEVAGEYQCAGEVRVTTRGREFSKLTGYVVEARERESQGADTLEVQAYSFDQFLRRDQVSSDLSGQTISSALETIITEDTPVAYNADKVTVGDNQELTRAFRGEQVETAIRELAFISENEEFGVDDDIEFFFREREFGTIARGIDNTQWLDYDIPELGKDVVNEAEVWYDGGDESVIVDDPDDKLQLQDALDLPDPGRQREEINRPQIANRVDAEAEGLSYLEVRQSTLTGTVTTYGLFNASPGDTIDITIEPRGIDEEFRVAAVEYRWLEDETVLTVVENRDTTNAEVLYRLSEAVDRVEMESADRTSDSDRVVSTEMHAVITPSGEVDETVAVDGRFVNDGRNKLREAWADRATINDLSIVVGDDAGGLSRTNTSLGNQTAAAAATVTLPDSSTARYSASISQTDVREIGLESDGTLIARLTFDTPQDISDVEIDLTVANDGDIDRGVVTASGQTAIRDLLANNDPDPPEQFAFGTGDSMPAESDTSLDARVESFRLGDRVVQSADSTADWEDLT